jgi:hypothetical protein
MGLPSTAWDVVGVCVCVRVGGTSNGPCSGAEEGWCEGALATESFAVRALRGAGRAPMRTANAQGKAVERDDVGDERRVVLRDTAVRERLDGGSTANWASNARGGDVRVRGLRRAVRYVSSSALSTEASSRYEDCVTLRRREVLRTLGKLVVEDVVVVEEVDDAEVVEMEVDVAEETNVRGEVA